IWMVKDMGVMKFYGTLRLKNLSPYWKMLLLMVPLIAIVSTQHDFLQKYPRAQVLPGFPAYEPNDLWQLILYELSYGFNFLSIELFFRGFLVMALIKYCGTKCIIPVACFYVAIHMGKPMGEAISSFFGGALLGIITYHTKSIWGGLIIHVGIAWMMEIGGAIGRYTT
ncbi:MAG: CPBP family intramembrane glutamic endopeptidase, partial [Chitinophagaceae bacterium]